MTQMTQYLRLQKIFINILMILNLLTRLASGLKNTALNHKKKLIFIAILIIGYKIIRRKIKTENIISIVMFFMKIWTKIIQIFPLPTDPNYRHLDPFEFVEEMDILQMVNVTNLKNLLAKIKNKQPNALQELKINVLSGVILNISLYKINIIYQLIHKKYGNDFLDLGAGTQFQQSINLLKIDFIKNLPHFKNFITSQIGFQLSKINLSEMVSVERIRQIFNKIINSRLFSESMDIKQKILTRKTYLSTTQQYKIADNYFRTSKEYQPQKINPRPIRIVKQILIAPFKFFYKGISSILKTPEQNLTSHRFQYIEYLYILPLKKYKNIIKWPNSQSGYLFDLVLDQILNFLYSINFSIFIQKKMLLNLNLFMNRVSIYFQKRAKCTEKKLMDLLPIFYKIVQEQMINKQRSKQFYERQLLNAFRDTKFKKLEQIQLADIRLRNKILQQIYFKNQVEHLQKDMQAKLYNQRDGLVLEPVPASSRFYEEKDQIQQLMQIHNRADQQKPTTREQMQMMRELMN